jgi:3-phenylpropionate/trans-cinnamate dioxygenase ferredoxin component
MSEVIVCRLDDLLPNSATKFVIAGVPIAIVRIDDDVYAISDTCTHADVSLSEGEVLCADKAIECWKHGSAFSLITGQPMTLPATQPAAVFQTRLIDGDVVIQFGAGANGVH